MNIKQITSISFQELSISMLDKNNLFSIFSINTPYCLANIIIFSLEIIIQVKKNNLIHFMYKLGKN